MNTLRVFYNPAAKTVRIREQGLADLSPPYVLAGSFVHDGGSDPEGWGGNHVMFHHVRDVLYKVGVQDMNSVGILSVLFVGQKAITFSDSGSISENTAVGTVISNLSVLNGSGSYIFTELSDPDNKFVIEGALVKLSAALDYETETSHTITVQADGTGGPITRSHTFNVTNSNEPVIEISNFNITESATVGTTVGVLSISNGSGSYTFSITADPDNKFVISGNNLNLAAAVDYETKAFHSVTIQAAGANGPVSRTINVNVGNVVEGTLAPTTSSINDNIADGATVFTLTGLDAGANETIASISPNDGRFAIASGNKIVKGLSAITAGTVSLTVTMSTGRTMINTITIVSTQLADFVFQAETDALQASRTAAGIPMTRAQKLAFDRLVVRVKGAGVTVTDWAALYVPSTPTEVQSRVNQIHPGTNDLTLVGATAPTYTANDRWSGFGSTAKYNTGIGLQSFAQGQFTIFYYSRTTTGAAGGDFGAQTASGDGIAANIRDASNKFNARLQGANYASVGTTFTPGQGMYSIRPNKLDTFGIKREDTTTTYVAPATNPSIYLGGINGGANAAHDCGLFAIFKVTLTDAQNREVSAALLDYYYKVRFGMVNYYEAGKAPTTADYDVVVYGASWTAVCAAYAAKQEGKTVCIVLDEHAQTDWDIGGMPASGLAYVDCYNFTALKGLYRDLTSWVNTTIINRADGNTQTGNSVESWQFVQGVRRMLDPSRTNGTLILGQDIPVYFSTGIESITAVGLKDTALHTKDGRTFTGKVFVSADYDGEYNHMSPNIPTITGIEAAGTGSEANNGYKGSGSMSKPYGTDIDPYITPGNSASGLLPDIQGTMPLPGLTIDGAITALQSMNFRLAMTTDPARMVPVTTMDPHRNYNAQRYETAARAYVTNTGVTIGNPATTTTILQFAVGGTTNKMDVNNGSGGLSTDLPGSGYRYATAANSNARKAVIDDLRDYQLGWFWWHANSGDSRIPSTLVTQFQAFGLDAGTFLDPGPNGLLFWPNRPYQRDPVWRLKNTGYVSTAQDYCKVDGSVPRSIKSVAVTSYDCDKHPEWKVVSGGLLYTQGSVPGGLVAGVDKMAPIPLEEIVPDVGTKTNVIVPWASSQTILCWYMSRLEPTGGLKGEAAGVIASMAIDGNIEVQNVDYTSLRTKLLARDVNHPYLPQVA